MSFCSFSKDSENSYTVVENKFIAKYLPEADGFAVKVYLYGLYLCAHSELEFSLSSMAEVLRCTEQQIQDAFSVWEDYDLVEVCSKSPYAVAYLPVKAAIGKPKKARYEQYADFNKELQRKMQKVGKFISGSDYVKYMRFLEDTLMQPQAFLMVADFCIQKQGEAISPSYIFNKAKKLIRGGFVTYEQVEKALSNYNAHEGELVAVYNATGVYQRIPDDTDYALYAKWRETLGFSKESILTAAKTCKRGSMTALDLTLEELFEKGKLESKEIESYLTHREKLASLCFRLGRKLGVKVQNPAPYIDEYVEKWYTYGFEDSSLLDLALFCFKTEQGSFTALGELVERLFKAGSVAPESVKEYLREKNADVKLLGKLQAICGGIRGNVSNLSMLEIWRGWNFKEEMLIEAARRSCASASPIPYMNKILSDWKQSNIFEVEHIPNANETKGAGLRSTQKLGGFTNESVEAANAKSARERYYALLREKALTQAEKRLKTANTNARFKEICAKLSKMELSLAKAEMYEPTKLPALQEEKAGLLRERGRILSEMGIAERELQPQFSCEKCSDTGFLPSGVACDCYREAK